MSSTRGFLKPYQIITQGDVSGNLTSAVTSINYLDNVSIQLNAVGTAVGTFDVEGSLDYFQDIYGNVVNAGNWVPITLSPVPTLAGANKQILLDLNQLSFPWIRVTYTSTSGAGTLDAYISAKQV
jgi:hypothetical protein